MSSLLESNRSSLCVVGREVETRDIVYTDTIRPSSYQSPRPAKIRVDLVCVSTQLVKKLSVEGVDILLLILRKDSLDCPPKNIISYTSTGPLWTERFGL